MDHQNLSEHVLCMVLYLIELGLENSPERESDEEVVRCFIKKQKTKQKNLTEKCLLKKVSCSDTT